MRILVTGINGFLGSQIVAALRRKNHHIVCAVRNAAQGHTIVFYTLLSTVAQPDLWLQTLAQPCSGFRENIIRSF